MYSSLAFHYIAELAGVFSAIRDVLQPDGAFVFSVEHPIYSAPSVQDFEDREDGRRVWPLDNYMTEGQRKTNWFTDGVLKQHRTVATYLNLLISAGFTLERVEEFGPTDPAVTQDPRWSDEQHRPQFLLVSAHPNQLP